MIIILHNFVFCTQLRWPRFGEAWQNFRRDHSALLHHRVKSMEHAYRPENQSPIDMQHPAVYSHVTLTTGAYNGSVPKKICPTQHTLLSFFLLPAGRAKTGWHSNTVIRCYRTLLSLSFVMDICNLVRFDTGVLAISEYFLDVL